MYQFDVAKDIIIRFSTDAAKLRRAQQCVGGVVYNALTDRDMYHMGHVIITEIMRYDWSVCDVDPRFGAIDEAPTIGNGRGASMLRALWSL